MKKVLATAAVTLLALTGTATAAQASTGQGHGFGVVVQECLDKSVGAAITAGKAAHPGVPMNARAIAESPHCAA